VTTPPQNPPPPRRNRGAARVIPKARQTPRVHQRRYSWQEPDELVIWIRRQSRWYLVASGWPILVGLFGLAVVWSFSGLAQGLPRLFALIVAVATLAFAIKWLITDFLYWLFTYYILTNQRVIASKGFFNRSNEEIPLKSVAQVLVDRPTPLKVALHIGDVMVRPIGTPIEMPGVANPREMADSILAVQANPPGTQGPPSPPAPQVRSPKIQAALDKLAEPMPMPPVQPVTRTPLWGVFQRRIPIQFIEGESVIEVIYRHWFVLLVRELPAAAILLGGVVLGLIMRSFAGATFVSTMLIGIGILFGGAWAVLIYLNYADDVFVLTTHRVIDIDRLVFILADYSNDAPYARIQNVSVARGPIGILLGFGSIRVDTSGRRFPVQMTNIPHPLQVMDQIFAQMNMLRDRENVALINKQKKENHRWMATVLNEMLVDVPDVRGMPVLAAMARARKSGLKLVVDVERPLPGTPPGRVVDQVPSPGTTELADNEMRVVLSGRGAP
jgi:membrane protein YdbS with pleckstrin-like domain